MTATLESHPTAAFASAMTNSASASPRSRAALSSTRGDSARHLLRVFDLTADEIHRLISRAVELKKNLPTLSPDAPTLRGKTLGLIFQKASTRTRISFEVAMARLGGHSLFLPSEALQLGRGEPIADTARVLSGYLDGLVIRTFEHATLESWARHASIPVINGLTDRHHPCQALSDLLTIQERFGSPRGLTTSGRFTGLKLAYIGDGNNVAHSLIEAAARTGLSIALACPKGYQPDPAILARARREARATGSTIELTTDPAAAAADSHILYTDVWTSMGQERQAARRRKAFRGFQVNRSLLARARPEAVVLHCLPAHRGEEIADDVMDGPHSAIFQQAENRLHMQKAVLEWLLNS
jgi:ornithine carbamoyltransferase